VGQLFESASGNITVVQILDACSDLIHPVTLNVFIFKTKKPKKSHADLLSMSVIQRKKCTPKHEK
jgi:hypothetical protein